MYLSLFMLAMNTWFLVARLRTSEFTQVGEDLGISRRNSGIPRGPVHLV